MVKTLPPVRPNAGITAAYRKRMDALIAQMQASVNKWIPAAYKANPPEMAQDASPARELQAAVRRLARRWQRRWNELTPGLAEEFARSVGRTSDQRMRRALRQAGITVNFDTTRTMNDVFQATVAENVSLIKSIPSEYFTQVEGLVMRSVQAGRDLSYLTDELEKRYGITRRRAALIARDQNQKATAALTRTRQQELGIEEAIWLHSAGGVQPRASHVAFSGKRFNIREGALIDGQRIWPGELINCRCVSKAVIPGFS